MGLTVRGEESVRMEGVGVNQAKHVETMISVSLHRMGMSVLAGPVDVSMTMTVLTLDHSVTRGDALKGLVDLVDQVDQVDLLLEVLVIIHLENKANLTFRA